MNNETLKEPHFEKENGALFNQEVHSLMIRLRASVAFQRTRVKEFCEKASRILFQSAANGTVPSSPDYLPHVG